MDLLNISVTCRTKRCSNASSTSLSSSSNEEEELESTGIERSGFFFKRSEVNCSNKASSFNVSFKASSDFFFKKDLRMRVINELD